MNTLRRGVQGPDVITWLNILTQSPVPVVWTNAAGVSKQWTGPWPLPQTMVFDSFVAEATEAWQFARGLVADGIVGPMTWANANKPNSIIIPSPAPLVKGTDSSSIQGKLDAPKLRLDDIVFGWARCKVGNNKGVDSCFAQTVKAFMYNEIFPGGYCFLFPLPHLNPTEQAAGFLEGLVVEGDVVGTMVGQLPIAIDLEWPPPESWAKYGCTADQIVDFALAVLVRIVQETGIRPVLYSYPYFLQSLAKAKNYIELVSYKLWIAGGAQYINGSGQWPNLTTYKVPTVPGWGHDWTFNQWDGNGGKRYASGMDADFNIFRYDYAKLQEFTQVKSSEPSPDTLPTIRTVLDETPQMLVPDAVHAERQDRANAFILQPV